MKIVIAGDLVPTEKNIQYFKEKKITEKLDNKFKLKWQEADYRIINLECPICENKNSIDKYGPCLSCPPDTIKGIKELNPNLILLSNNHIKDYGVKGIRETIKILEKNKIPYIGIVENNNQTGNYYILEKEEIKVGVYNICDNEFSVAKDDELGASGIQNLKNYKDIKKMKEICDYVIVIYHGGKEYYRYPSPELQQTCKFFSEIGADIVVCQHSHCIGTKEEYNNSTIIYGQGNFIFDDDDNEYEQTSLILECNFTKEKYDIKYIPIEKYNNLIKLSDNKKIVKEFFERAENIKDNNYIKKQYDLFSEKKLNNYMSYFKKKNILTRIANKFFYKNYYIRSYKKQELIKIINIIECNAHRETLLNGLKKYIERK